MTIEELVIDYLTRQNIPGIGLAVYAETPVDPPENYVLIQRSNGSMANYLRDFSIYTETVSRKDKLMAARLHETVIEAMLRMPDIENIFRCNLNSDYDATRAEKKDYRYQALWQITK